MPDGDTSSKQPAGRRRLPASGSVGAIKQIKSRVQELHEKLNGLSAEQLADELKKKRRFIYAGLAASSAGLVVYIVAVICHWSSVIYFSKFSVIALPICIAISINELCQQIARRRPLLAQRVLAACTFGNAQSITTLANIYIDSGDYQKAEKLLSKAVKRIDPKRRLRDYILLHAFHASTMAHLGRIAEAKKLIKEVLEAAENHHKAAPTDGTAFLVAGTLNYASEVCDMADRIQDAMALSRRSVDLVCSYKNPPPYLVLSSLVHAAYFSNVVGDYPEALAYSNKAQEIMSKIGTVRDSQAAVILASLGIANLGLGRGTVCKRFLTDEQTRALEPLGLKERPMVFQSLAIYHFAHSRIEDALVAYETAMEACQMLKPRESVYVLRIIREYAVLLQESGKPEKARQKEQEVTKITQMIETINMKL